LVAALLSYAELPVTAQTNEEPIRRCAVKIASSMTKAQRRTVAVVDFTDLQGNVTELGRFIAEQLSVLLENEAHGFEVVDRSHIKALLIEHKLSSSGLIDPETVRQLGKIAGVEALVTGTVTPLGDSVSLSVKLLDTNTARILGASLAELPRTGAIDSLLSKGIDDGHGSERGSSSTTRAPQTSAKTAAAAAPKRVPPFDITLDKCEHSAEGVSCFLLVTNTGSTATTIALASSTYPPVTLLYDKKGGEYRIAAATIGSRDWHSNEFSSALVSPNIPIRAKVAFADVPAESTSGTLQLVLAAGASFQGAAFGQRASWRTIVFEDVPFR
jgi:TolB-like protein